MTQVILLLLTQPFIKWSSACNDLFLFFKEQLLFYWKYYWIKQILTSFVNLRPIFTISRILAKKWNSCDITWYCLPWKPFWWEIMCYHSYQTRYIIKLAVGGWLQGVHNCVIHHWKAEVFSILLVYGMFFFISGVLR